MKPEEKWNNTVIEVLDREHGNKVIEWWKRQGMDTDLEGHNSKEDDDYCRFYGLINGKFDSYNINTVQGSRAKIISLNEPLKEWWEQVPPNDFSSIFPVKKLPMKITAAQAQRIINKLHPTLDWREKVLGLWAKSIVLYEEIEVSDQLYQEGYKEASPFQQDVFDEVFGKGNSVVVNTDTINRLVSVRDEGGFKDESILLNRDYNWDIKIDYMGELCLIPTKK
jgi:hypothetical protein